MRIDRPENESEPPIRPRSVSPPPTFSSRAIRLKLLMLFGMLILVIVLMKEAGKPERWEWMGFDKQQKIELDSQTPTTQTEGSFDAAAETSTVARLDIPNRVSGSDSTEDAASQNINTPSTAASPKVAAELFDADYPGAGIDFWSPLFQKMNAVQQQTLLLLLKSMRQGKLVPADQQENATRLVSVLQQQRQDFHQKLFDQLTITPNNSSQKTKLADDFYESQEIWDQKIFPALSAAAQREDITVSQQQAIVRLQKLIDPLLLQQVQDLTSIGWTGDSAAWKRLWEKSLQDDPTDFEPVTRIQLMSQSDFYRGQPVMVEGWIRSARRQVLGADSELGLSHYYILWVRPKETKLGPFCVYTSSLPSGFPEISDQFTDVNKHVRIDAYFFKIRTYVAGDESVRNCPLLISKSVQPITSVPFTSVNRWQPSRTTLLALLTLIPVVATVLAWWAFRTSETNRHSPGAKAEQRINTSLNDLVDDSRVQTDHEKIMSLYETESDFRDE